MRYNGRTYARDKTCGLQNFQVLGDGGEAHVERLRQFLHGGLAEREAGEDRAPRRIGEGLEGDVEGVCWHGSACI